MPNPAFELIDATAYPTVTHDAPPLGATSMRPGFESPENVSITRTNLKALGLQ
jgi:hypothetical protein